MVASSTVAPSVLAPSAAALTDLSRTLQFVCETLVPNLARTTDETRQLLAALDGAYVPAGPAGSPSRGMAHVLPTGRNFYTVDPRGLPTPAAWSTGAALAREALARHFAEKGQWPESIALTCLGHADHAHRRRRYRAGAGAAGRAPGLGTGDSPYLRPRDHSAVRAGPSADRCHVAGQRLFPRCLSRP